MKSGLCKYYKSELVIKRQIHSAIPIKIGLSKSKSLFRIIHECKWRTVVRPPRDTIIGSFGKILIKKIKRSKLWFDSKEKTMIERVRVCSDWVSWPNKQDANTTFSPAVSRALFEIRTSGKLEKFV